MNFYSIVLTIAIILLILVLTYVGIIMQNAKHTGKVVFPPVESKCPDYWEYTGNSCVVPVSGSMNTGSIYNGNNTLLINNGNTFGFTTGNSITGNSISAYVDFNDKSWSSLGLSGVCQKQKWANMYGIQWDGVSNYNSC